MASNPIGREAQPVTLPGTIPPMPAVARILSRYDRGKLAAFVSVAIDLLDVMDGDPEAEDNADREGTNGDETDIAWPEWNGRKAQVHGGDLTGGAAGTPFLPTEDDEDDDPAGQYDEDCWTGPAVPGHGAGCPISDPGEHADGF